MNISLLLATPGVGLRSAEDQIRSREGFAVEDVEQILVDNPANWINANQYSSRNMRGFLYNNHREDVLKSWHVALKSALDNLSKSPEPNKVLCLHPTLFNERRSEFVATIPILYSEITSRQGKDAAEAILVKRVILLIDDIYDMWHRLGKEDQGLFNFERWHTKRLAIEYRSAPAAVDRLTAESQELLRADSAVTILSQLLWWRRLDMIACEQLSSINPGTIQPVTILGVKHPLKTLLGLLDQSITRTSYLSHQISSLRRHHVDGSSWPKEVNEANQLPNEALDRHLALICPTAIDEFRFRQPEDVSVPFARTFALGDRWPLLENPSNLIVPIDRVQDLPADVPKGDGSESSVGMHARTIERLIRTEFPFRDHFLVAHTDAFFVYRPFSETGRFSGGVAAEIDHFQDYLFSSGNRKANDRRGLFLHAASDVLRWISVLSKPELRNIGSNIRSAVRRDLASQFRSVDMADRLIAGGTSDSTDLDIRVTEQQAKIVSASLLAAAEEEVFHALTKLESRYMKDPSIAIYICQDPDSMTATSRTEMFSFLKGESQPYDDPIGNREIIASCLGQSIVDWASEISEIPLVD